jgi:D-beta-D-heptose 7-phosphate kinase/D-beta-D-heptose 1-phosphate adenosyltransferase
LILSDYSKGLLTQPLLNDVIAAARRHGLPVVVDPKTNDFTRYDGATLVTPNCAEAERATGIAIKTNEDAERAGHRLLSSCSINSILITRGPHGMSLISSNGPPLHLASGAVEVFDVVGAGDTVIATIACILSAGGSLEEATASANVAAGIVVGKQDTSTVSPDEIIDHLEYLAAGRRREGTPLIFNKDDLLSYISSRRSEGKRIGFTNGVFDIVHPGHVSLLRFARDNCDVLIVGLNSDASVRRLGKGPNRPINDELDRATVLGAFGMVNATIIFDEDTPIQLIEAIRPDVLIKGADYSIDTVVGSGFVKSYGGEVILAPIEDGKSSTGIIQKTLTSLS